MGEVEEHYLLGHDRGPEESNPVRGRILKINQRVARLAAGRPGTDPLSGQAPAGILSALKEATGAPAVPAARTTRECAWGSVIPSREASRIPPGGIRCGADGLTLPPGDLLLL